MATKKIKTPTELVSTGILDLTKTGPLSYRLLQQLNSGLPEETLANLLLMSSPGLYNALSRAGQVNYTEVPSDFGSSIFDSPIVGQEELENYTDYRAERQPWYAKVGAGLAKGAVLAGTTFLDGTLGLIIGGTLAIKEGRVSAIWDNDFSKAMQEINELSELAMPNYYTQEELNSPWYENIFTANFLGDKFIKNLGFSVGAIYSGGAWTKALRLPQVMSALKASTNVSSMVLAGVGATISAVNEGRIEALNNSTEWFNSQKEQLDNLYLTGQLSDLDYEEAIAKISDDRLKMGNADLLMNIPILTASNLIQFGKMYAGGFKTARKANNIVGKVGDYAAGSSKLQGALTVTKSALSEGMEEISQKSASSISADYYGRDVNNFYKSKIDPNAELETLSWIKSFASGINETVNDSSSWEEFFIGTLTGALGIPNFKKKSSGKYGFTIEGGAYNEWKDYQLQMTRDNEIANYMNSRVNSPEFKNYYQGLIRHNKYQNDMNLAALNDDEFNYKNAEYALFTSDISMFDNAGKIDDLVTLIDSSFDTSDENLQSIIDNTTSTADNGKKVGPFIDSNGNPMTATEEGKKQMIDKLTQTKDEMKKQINDYIKIKNNIDIATGQNLTDDLLEELTWLKGQINNWRDRSNTIAEEIKPLLSKLVGELTAERDLFARLKEIEGASHTDITDAYELFNKKHKGAVDALLVVEMLIHSPNLAYVLASSKNLINGLKQALEDTDSITADEINDFIKKVDDIVKLSEAQLLYSKKLKEYLDNPLKLAEDHLKINEEAAKTEDKRLTTNFKDKLSTATDLNTFRQTFDAEEDSTLKAKTLSELENEGNELAKNYIETEQYNKDVQREINSLNVLPLVKQDALKLFNDQYNNSSTLEEIANFDSPYIDNENAFDESSEGDIELSANRFINALYAVQTAMSKVNNDNKFKDRFAPEFKRPIEKPEKVDKTKGTTSDTTGDSGTSTIPDANPVTNIDSYVPPVGNVTADMVMEENKTHNDRAETTLSFDKKQTGNRPYYRPAIPELHIVGSKEGDFRPFNEVVKEKESGVNFDNIYNYLATAGAFTYINEGKIKAGDEILFMIDPNFNDKTIFMVDAKNHLIIGSLDESEYSVNRYEGLAGLQEKIRAEYNARENKEGKFYATPRTKVSQMMIGKIPYSSLEKSLADIPNVREEGKSPILGIIKNGTLTTGGLIEDSKIIKPVDMSLKEGRLYLLIPNAAGKYSPVAVRVKHFNNTEFNLDDITVANTPVAKHLIEDINKLAEVTNEDELKSAVKALSNDLYIGEMHIDWASTDKSTAIVFKKAVRDSEGNEIYDTKDGKRIRRETIKTVFLTEKPDPNLMWSYGENGEVITSPNNRSVEDIAKDIRNTLLSFNLPLQVSVGMINKGGYNNMLINSNILTSNISNAKVIGSWFTTDYFDNEGNLHLAISPASITPLPERKVETPVGGKEGAISGTKIVRPGIMPYYVDLTTNTIRDELGKTMNFTTDTQQLYFDLAWALDNFGDSTEGSMMKDNKVVLPSGRVLDRNKGTYITGLEAQNIKDSIIGVDKTIKQRREKANRIVGEIYENLNRVDKTRTDGLYYYILEDDGKYHEYSRVHSALGSNWKESPRQIKALEDLRIQLSLHVDKGDFNNYLRWIENHYKMAPNSLGMYNDKTDAKSRDMIVALVRDHMSGTNSVRALNAGTAVDTIIRLYFTMLDVSKIVKPSNMTENAFINLITRLLLIKSNIELSGETFLADNIVLFQAYPDGRRIAGEVDILAKTSDGRFKIYDVKTSKYSFYDFTDRYGHKVNYFTTPSSTLTMSNKDYYTMQLSAYKNLFESLYNYPISDLAIMPFVLSYDKDLVSNIIGEKGIPIKYNPNINVPLVNTTILETKSLTKNTITVDGVTISITKTPNMTKGLGDKEEHAASYNYSVVFSNGESIEVIKNANINTTDEEAYSLIKKALEGNLKRLHEMDSVSTKKTQITEAAKTVTKELAANNSDDEFEDEFTLRKATEETPILWDKEKELKWLKDVLPQLDEQGRIKIIKGLIKVAERGPRAWGLFDKGIMKLSDIAAEGTTYHEAFHVVFNLLLDNTERDFLFAEARKKWGEDRRNSRLEELMAEDFREYVMTLEDRTLSQKIKDFFINLFAKVTNWKYIKPSLNNYYRMINQGKYRNMKLGQSLDIKNREVEEGFNEDGTVKTLQSEARVTNWDILDSEDRTQLVNKGWTEEQFNSISQQERDQVVKCIGF